MSEVHAKVSTKALVFHGVLILCMIGIITIWKPLGSKLSCKLSHDGKKIHGEIGILKKTSMDSPISKVSSIKVDQSVIGRLLNYGTVSINLTGDSDDYSFSYIDDPNAFRNSVLKAIK